MYPSFVFRRSRVNQMLLVSLKLENGSTNLNKTIYGRVRDFYKREF